MSLNADFSNIWNSDFFSLARSLQGNTILANAEGNKILQSLFFTIAQHLRPTLFMDIGANDGTTSIVMRQLLPECAIHSFEANPKIFSKNLARLRDHDIHFWNLAINSTSGRTTIYAPLTLSQAYVDGEVIPARVIESEDTGKSSLLHRNENATYAEFDVESKTLDAFIRDHVTDQRGRNTFLWIDVEGASDRVIQGADQTLSHTQAIFLEVEGFPFWKEQASSETVLNHLARSGFIPVARDHEYGDKQFNILFIHTDIIKETAHILAQWSASLSKNTIASPRIKMNRANPSLSGILQENIPILIPCFETVTYVRNMVDQLREFGLKNIILVDNASTYEPMRDFLDHPGKHVTVVRQIVNKGPRDIFVDSTNYVMLPEIFCVTDPDLCFNVDLPHDFIAQLAALTVQHAIGKAGFALDISNRDAMQQNAFQIGDKPYKIWDWEQRFWNAPIGLTAMGDPIYNAPIDTTFAVYNKRFFNPRSPLTALRVGGRFTCQHLPWYTDNKLPPEEERHYRKHALDSFYLKGEHNPRLE